MKRFLLIPLLALLPLLALAGPASSATNEVKRCGKAVGWEINAGNLNPRFPKTKCSFAEGVFERVAAKPGLDDLKKRFTVTHEGRKLRCKSRKSGSYEEFRCKGNSRFVLAYKF